MKNILKIGFGIGLLGLLATSCSEDQVSVYSGPDAINILINDRDSAEVSFLSLPVEDTVYTFNVEVTVQTVIADRDRVVNFVVGPRTTAKEENFEMVRSIIIPKGETSAILPVKVYEKGLIEIPGGLVAEVVVVPSDDFVGGVNSKMKLTFSGDFPISWLGDTFWVGYALGRCTKAKYEFVYMVLGTIDLSEYDEMYPSINLAARLNQELDKWAEAHGGERLPDVDGSAMKFSNAS